MKNFSFLLTLLFFSFSYSQVPPPPGCYVLTALESDNDGFASFNLEAYFIQFRNEALTIGFDLSGYQIAFYPSEMDFNQGTNQITNSPYTNIVMNEQFCYMRFIYSGTGPLYTEADLLYYFSCHKLEVTSALATSTKIKDLLEIYPNPVSGLLYIKANSAADFSITIFDLNGRPLIQKINSTNIDLSKLQNGIYIVNITSNAKRFAQKITVAN